MVSDKMSKKQTEKLDKWEIEDALRTIQRSEDIIKDKKLMKEVKKLASDQQKVLNKIVKK